MPEDSITASRKSVPQINLRRRLVNVAVTYLAVGAVILVLTPLVAVFGYLVYRGVGSVNWAFLTQTPKPVGEAGGGMANAIAGSAFILFLASVIGVPFGIGAGIYLAEYGRNRFGDAIRFTADVLNGVPSIVIGIVAYGIVVLTQRHFSALAGGVALSLMMIPIISRTTEEMLLLVPNSLREASYGLGISRWRTTLSITLRTVRPAKLLLYDLPPLAINIGTTGSISPPPRCPFRYSLTLSRLSTNGTAKPGPERLS